MKIVFNLKYKPNEIASKIELEEYNRIKNSARYFEENLVYAVFYFENKCVFLIGNDSTFPELGLYDSNFF